MVELRLHEAPLKTFYNTIKDFIFKSFYAEKLNIKLLNRIKSKFLFS